MAHPVAVEMRGVTKRFGALVANDAVTLKIATQTIHAVIGENGAGKSTAMNVLYGLYQPDAGEIFLHGQSVRFASPRDAIAAGLGMVHQHFMLVPTLTVLENIVLGAEPRAGLMVDYTGARQTLLDLCERYKLRANPDALIGDLSVGEQQRVEILKTLYRGAEVLILDEPTAVLTPPEVEELFAVLRALRKQGKTIIIITHKLAEVLAISDRVTVMRDGRVVDEVETHQTSAEDLARLMVGREVLLRVEKTPAHPQDTLLEVSRLSLMKASGARALEDVSFNVRAGEIVGIAGVEGNGQSELVECLAGLLKPTSGDIRFSGKSIIGQSPRSIRALGVAHIPEDRHKRALLLDFDLSDNTILGDHYRPPAVRFGFLDRPTIDRRTDALLRDFDVRPPQRQALSRSLSGGNQQKLVVGREFELPPRLLLVSQPTRGVDIGAIEFIHRKLIALRDAGVGILLVSAELEEVLSLSDRLLVMYDGRIVGETDPATASQSELGLMMTGATKTSHAARGA
ncbi:MAG: ABC transporter ATP-binding protein [Chloracidobacterium sp.]|uniref:ABC transporter ATP-binding protein n=1 Tax=Chloracidobacterium validum TaxID=2821543 RepID=A0ABX8B9I2_9BACT|nr:ABC transporter ATP-binding protein [Chloracidobacterium validum]QUW02210.1 ABC transporter ATP-binding protein [Chloracidobacterium validum]